MPPAVSDRQRRFMMAEASRKEHGQKTKTGMSLSQLLDYRHVVKKAKKKTR